MIIKVVRKRKLREGYIVLFLKTSLHRLMVKAGERD